MLPICNAARNGARRLRFELLESQRVDSAERDRTIERLADFGIQPALDDLGSSYSFLERLKSRPFDVVKVDRTLEGSIWQSPVQTMSLVRATMQMVLALGRNAVLEALVDAALIEAAGVFWPPHDWGLRRRAADADRENCVLLRLED